MTTVQDLSGGHCVERKTGLDEAGVAGLLPLLPAWRLEDGKLCRSFTFRNYYQTIAFVNALAYMTHAQDHHPELTIGYNNCLVTYRTHSVGDNGGLSENDFICAAKADAIFFGGAQAKPGITSK
jgi:4a-hydroxytetrahydrobiopterin dehydratase